MDSNVNCSKAVYKEAHPIVIAGSGRGGTTWLLELVCSDSSYKPVFEPLHELKVPSAEPWAYGYLKDTFISSEAEAFFQTIFDGSLKTPWTRLKPWMNEINSIQDKLVLYKELATHQINEIKSDLVAKQLVVKFIRANLMLPWLHTRFGATILLVVRSPYDICSSMIRTGWFENHLNFGYKRYLEQEDLINDFLKPHIEWMRKVEDPLERVCIMWVIENMIPLTGTNSSPMTVVPYEYMIHYKPKHFRSMFRALGIDVNFDETMINKPSSRSVDGKRLEKRPQDELEKRCQDLLPKIMERFSFDLYTIEGLPNELSPIYSRWNIGLFKPQN